MDFFFKSLASLHMHIYTIALVKAGTALVAKVVETELMKDNDTGVRERVAFREHNKEGSDSSHKSTR